MYTDQSGEIRKVCINLGVLHDKSQPGVPQNNAMIERTNQHIRTKTIVALLEVGVPLCYWSVAAPCVCVNVNSEFENGEIDHALTHGVEFPNKRVPFGCKVLYNPSATKLSEHDGKRDAPSSVGIFAGYVMHPGYVFKGEYLIWDLLYFGRGADLSNLARSMNQRIRKPHVSMRCELYDGGLHFKVKAEHEQVNHSLEGQQAALLRHPLQGLSLKHI